MKARIGSGSEFGGSGIDPEMDDLLRHIQEEGIALEDAQVLQIVANEGFKARHEKRLKKDIRAIRIGVGVVWGVCTSLLAVFMLRAADGYEVALTAYFVLSTLSMFAWTTPSAFVRYTMNALDAVNASE